MSLLLFRWICNENKIKRKIGEWTSELPHRQAVQTRTHHQENAEEDLEEE